MTRKRTNKRAYGSGSIVAESGCWYGKWRVGDRQVKRLLGPVRPVGSSEGLTRTQAEAALRRLIGEVRSHARGAHHLPAGRRPLRPSRRARPRTQGLHDPGLPNHHSSAPRAALFDHPDRPDQANRHRGVHHCQGAPGLAVKTITNHLNFAHGVFRFALKRGWATSNPVAAADRPRAAQADPDIRFLTTEESRRSCEPLPATTSSGQPITPSTPLLR